MNICNLCQSIFVERDKLIANGGTFKHHDIVRLQSSAASGCHLCLIFWNDASRTPESVLRLHGEVQKAGRALEEQIIVVVDSLNAGEESLHCRLMAFLDNPDARHKIAGCFILFEAKHSVNDRQSGRSQRYPVANISSLSTGSPESLEQSATWIRICLETHVACRRQTPAVKPSRLVQVENNGGMVRLRLRDAGELAEDVVYTTLSHCWGRGLSLKLSKDCHNSFKVMISFADLPRTFQEAVYVTMYLGVSYIWIDALCIIQDSNEDWAREAALMDEVYTYALVNLAAAASSDSSGGLFRYREPRSITPCSLSLKDGSQALVYSAWTGIDFLNSPLNSRGWVLQESILATRQLSFTTDSIHWECNFVRACEQLPVRMLPDGDWTDLKGWKSDLLALEGGRSQSKFTAMWTEIVQRYSRCDLTYGSDKLIAISGIAERMGLRMGFHKEDYFAGMWRQDLLRQLLWYSFDPGTRSEEYRAPSWSWASIDTELVAIEYEDSEDVEVARLIDIRTEHDGNPFGMLKWGYCCIQGSAAHLSLAHAPADDEDNGEEPRGEQTASINGGAAFRITLWEFQADEGFELQMENNRWHRELSNYLVLQLAQSPGYVHGLILEATDIVGRFKRWGLFSSSREELAVAFRESVQITHRPEGFPEEYCQGVGYTVMIA